MVATIAVAFNVFVAPIESAHAQTCRDVEVTKFVDGAVITAIVRICDGEDEPIPAGGDPDGPSAIPTVGLGGCLSYAFLAGLDPQETCIAEADEPEPTLSVADVARAFQSLPLPGAALQVQPPNGRTIVNFDTNFFTLRDSFNRSVTLLGRRVRLRIFPTAFTWQFGDGDSLTTTTPGAAYPDLEVTHRYLSVGAFAAGVDTTYGADWRVGSGPWQPVPGTVTIAGDSVALEAVEVRPTLVSNP